MPCEVDGHFPIDPLDMQDPQLFSVLGLPENQAEINTGRSIAKIGIHSVLRSYENEFEFTAAIPNRAVFLCIFIIRKYHRSV